ncbi:MAG: acyl-CoA dehydrogenase family protein, partial [Alphaproteobacteria bacterium]|nr:acyl-CoA dehydrogenase family protein [Alphaproteobacteria bacterium]
MELKIMAKPGQSTIDPEDERLILENIDRFLERDVRPYVTELESTDTYPAEIVEKLKELGLFGATISEEYGGLGLPVTTYARIVERISGTWMSVSGIINS